MQTLTFEPDFKNSNANFNPSNEIWIIRMQILNIRKGFETFECKVEQFKRDLNDSNANSNHSKGIWNIRM